MRLFIFFLALFTMVESAVGNTIIVSGDLETILMASPDANDNVTGEVRFLPKLELSREGFIFIAEGDFRADEFSNGSIDRLNDQADRWAIGVRELYAGYGGEWFSAKVGRQIFDWSVTDTVSPSDMLTPFDLTRPIDRERMAVPAMAIKIGDDSRFLEAVTISKVTPSRLPQGNWDLFTDLPAEVSVADQEESSKAQFAVRGKYLAGDWDLGLILYDGVGFSPNARLEMNPFGMQLVPFYDELQAGVVSVAKELFGSIVRAEVGYFDHEIGDDFWSYAVSVDRELPNLFRDTDHLYLLIQYSDQVVDNHGSSPDGWVDFRRVFDNSITAKINYSPSDMDVWLFGAEVAHALDDQAGYAKFFVTWKNYNWEKISIEIETGLNFFWGDKDSFWGNYQKEGNSPTAFVLLKFSF